MFYKNRNEQCNKEIINRKEAFVMALFKTVTDAEAMGKVRRVYDDIKATKEIDFVPNFWQALSNTTRIT